MDLPNLRHFHNEGIYHITSDPVEALIGEAWMPAIYTDKGWATVDGATLLSSVIEWREERQGGKGDEGVQGGHATQRQARPRQRRKGQKPEASDSNRAE
jgi:hypothetical protein